MFPQIARGRKRAIEKCMPTWNLLFARAKKKTFFAALCRVLLPFSLSYCLCAAVMQRTFLLSPISHFPRRPPGERTSKGKEKESPLDWRGGRMRAHAVSFGRRSLDKKSLSLRFLLFSSSLSLSVFLSVSFEVNWMEKREAVLLRKMFIASSS